MRKQTELDNFLEKYAESDRNTHKLKNFIEKKNMITEEPCHANFRRDQDKILTREARKTGLGFKKREQKDETVRLKLSERKFLAK